MPDIKYKIKDLYSNLVLKYANKHKIIVSNICNDTKSVIINLNVYALLTGFELSFNINAQYNEILIKEENKISVKNIKVKDEKKITKYFAPLFDHKSDYYIEDYNVMFNLIDNPVNGSYIVNIIVDDLILDIFDLEPITLTIQNYSISSKLYDLCNIYDEASLNLLYGNNMDDKKETTIIIIFNGQYLMMTSTC
jgi:hypothetical protein